MVSTEKKVQTLQKRVVELERQLAEAQAAMAALTSPKEDKLHADRVQQAERQNLESSQHALTVSEERFKQAILVAPYPLMIRREDGQVVMINTAWTEITGYALEEIPTIEAWTRKAYGELAPQTQSLILNKGFSQEGVEKWGEFEVTTRSGEKRIWDFSTAPLGYDEHGRGLVMTMAVDITEHKQAEQGLRAARDEARWLARLPGENPNPVVRVSKAGIVLYRNPPAENLPGWTCAINEPLPMPLLPLVQQAMDRGQAVERDVSLGEKFYSVFVVPLPEEGYANLYGRDISGRKQMEEQLQESEHKYSLLFGKSAVPGALLRLPEVVIVDANESLERLVGYTRQEMHGKTADELGIGRPEEIAQAIAKFNRQGSLFGDETRIFTKAGEERIIAVNLNPLEFGGQRYAISTMQDITERKRAEEALKASKNRINDILKSLGDGLFALDKEWKIIYVNQRAAQIAAYPAEALVGKSLWELWPKLIGTALESFYRRAMEKELPGQFRVQGNETGRWYDVSVYPSSEGISIFYVDKTEQILAEERFNKAFHASPSALVISRQEDGRIETINDTFVKLFGYGEAEVIGKTSTELHMFANPADRQEAIRRLQEDKAVVDFELDVRLKSGEIRNASLSIEMIDIGGERMMLTTIQDVTLRKRAEEHIAYQAWLLANVNDAIVGADAQLRLTVWNAAAEAMYGWKAEEVLGQNGIEVFQTQSSHEDQAARGRLIAETGRWRGEATHLRKDGSPILVEISSMVLRDESGQISGYVSVNRDITERKQAEEALRKSEERFAKAFHASPDAVIISRLSDGLIMEVNEGWSTIFGYKQSEAQGRTTLELGIYLNLDDRKEAIDRLKENGLLRDFEVEIRRKSGEIRQASMSAERMEINGVECLLAIMRDITEQKQAEQALRVSEQRLQRAQEIAHLGSWELDLLTNRLTWSDEVYRIFGLQPQEFGATYEAFLAAVHPDERAAVDNAYSSSIRDGRDTYEIEHRVVKRSSGEVRIVHEKCEHFRNQGGQIILSVGMVHDITERKRAEEQSKDYAERLERSNRELEQFAFMASHDLQEPLRKIEMFGDLLLERATHLNEHERNYLERMRNAAGRMRDMVEGLLQLSRVVTQGKPFIRVDLSQITSEVLSDLDDQIRRTGGKVDLGVLPIIEGDPLQLHQLMQNLIGNALKYHEPERPPKVSVLAKQLSGKVQILVEDQGIGFEQADAERIFQPFQRLVGRSQYEGSGMGLAICRRIVERHSGKISAFSKPGHGTTMIITLPVRHAESARNKLRKDVNNEDPGTTPGG